MARPPDRGTAPSQRWLLKLSIDEAGDPTVITPGALVVTGDDDHPEVAIVVEHVTHPRGTIVRLDVLPGAVERYLELAWRQHAPV